MSIELSSALMILLGVVLIAALPAWPYSARWGFGPGAAIGLMLAIAATLVARGQI